MRKAQGVMQMRQTRQMQIDEHACIRNSMDEPTSRESYSLYIATTAGELRPTTLSKEFVAVCCLRKKVRLELVAPIPKSWFVRQKKVLGANIHETQSLFQRFIALPDAQW